MRSSLPCCRLCSFTAGTKLMRPHIKCIESVAIICSCVSLNTCLIISKRFIIRLADLSNSSKSQDVWKDDAALTAHYSYSVLSPQRRCEGSVLGLGRSVFLSASVSWNTHSHDYYNSKLYDVQNH